MILLPRKDDQDRQYISYSQIKLWNEAKAFNTGLPGKQEFIRHYFLGEQYPDKGGYGTFGSDAEEYITERKGEEKFTEDERKVLETIQPLGVFQKEIKLQFDDFYLKGFIDDADPELTRIRDYKTASLNSKKKYEENDYWQLDVYSLAIKQETGKLPNQLEVCIIERNGNGFKGGRQALTVGANVWYVQRQTSPERLKTLEQYIINTTQEISDYYQVFLKLNT